MKNQTLRRVTPGRRIQWSMSVGLFAVFAADAVFVHAGQPAITGARLLNPKGFVNNGTIHLKPNAPDPPPPTTIIVDTTLNPLTSGSVTPAGNLYTIGTNYGVTAGNNEFFSFSTFNLGTGDTANFVVPTSTTANIISRVTGGASTTFAGTDHRPSCPHWSHSPHWLRRSGIPRTTL